MYTTTFHRANCFWLPVFLLLTFTVRAASPDTNYIKSLYDRCLDFDESKTDSLCIYADLIYNESRQLNFNKGPVLSLRLKGICSEYRSDYNTALDFYLQSLDAARLLGQIRYVISAMNDVAMTYSYIGQAVLAKKYFLQCANLALTVGELSTVITTYSNLGATFSQLHQYDSALVYLLKTIDLAKPLGDSIDLSTTYNNIGNAYYNKKQYLKALDYFMVNFRRHQVYNELGSLWTDHLNIADVFLSTGKFDSAKFHADEAMKLAIELKSKSKEADSYSLFSRYYLKKGDYKNAYQNLQAWYRLDTALVNGNTQTKIAELQEKFNAKGRETENQLLTTQVERQNYRTRTMMLIALALGSIVLLITTAFVTKRNANRKLLANNSMILQQNEKLAELNQEKNSLIGIVSHDLGSPFATIQLWGQILEADAHALTDDQQKAIQRIIRSANHGQDLIKNILDVEKIDIVREKIRIERFDIAQFIESIVQGFQPSAKKKQINLYYAGPDKPIHFLSDKQHVQRIVENLVSNAIKYTPIGKRVWVSIIEEEEHIVISVTDEGVGIEKDELPLIFTKYGKISSRPTDGESSTGLGLSIVRKIIEDIGGSISCGSEVGKGTNFLVKFKK